ncbi:MAG: ABATE domain-containing protein [Pseudoxanthomonas sp.]
MREAKSQEGGWTDAPLVGDHVAMDLLNTEARDQGRAVDYWQRGEDVQGWLHRLGIVPSTPLGLVAPAQLLNRARTLRAVVRTLFVARVSGQAADPGDLNTFLHGYQTSAQLLRDTEGRLQLARVAHGNAISLLLGPVAEAAARLLVEGDVALIKQCEHPDCILWFYDRTKSHKRRWCSMALCGNRHKATQFRKRSNAKGETAKKR